MRLLCRSLTVIKRCLTALDSLEETGAAVNMIRADLSTLADELELETGARASEAARERRENLATHGVRYED